MPRWIQHPITHELIPADEYQRPVEHRHFIQGDIDSFVSPVDKRVISDRRHLRDHNREHGVTDFRDYGPEYFKKKEKERAEVLSGAKDRNERKRAINEAIERLNSKRRT